MTLVYIPTCKQHVAALVTRNLWVKAAENEREGIKVLKLSVRMFGELVENIFLKHSWARGPFKNQ